MFSSTFTMNSFCLHLMWRLFLLLCHQLVHVTTTQTTWRPVGTGPPSCWWETLSTDLRWTSGRSGACSLSCCRGSLCGPGSLTWTNCTWSGRLSVRTACCWGETSSHILLENKEKWAWFTKQCVTLVFLVLRRRSDPSTPAGLQQQPVLLWSFRPGATGDGETHRTLRLHASSLNHVKSKTSLKRLSFLSVGTFGAEISKSVASSSESHEGKDVTCSLMEILFLHQRQRINLKQNTHERLRSNLNVHVLLHFFYCLKKCL